MQELKEIWEGILEILSDQLTTTIMNLWFKDAKLLTLDSTTAVISHPSRLKKGILETRYSGIIEKAFRDLLGFEINVRIVLSPDSTTPGEGIPTDSMASGGTMPGTATVPGAADPVSRPDGTALADSHTTATGGGSSDAEALKPAPVGLDAPTSYPVFNDEYTFDNFVVGSSNTFAHAACTAVAAHPAVDYNPLFIYGASGLGKTHLLYAIMNEIKRKDPDTTIIYVKGDEFTNQMIESISTKSQDRFRAKYRKADVLLIDDIQFIAGKEATQEEFFHTFNALYEDHKQIILTSDRPPRDIKTLEDRLRTRFEWGLIADIQPPDFELRIAIMKNKANMMGMTLPDEVLNLIAENLKSNIRQIEGAIKRICAHSFLNGEPITVELARECISALVISNDPPELTARKIVETVSKKYGVPVDEIYGRKRNKQIANARNISIYIIRQVTSLSQTAIAQLFSRDHTTVISSLKAVESEIKTNSLFEIEISEMIKEITE